MNCTVYCVSDVEGLLSSRGGGGGGGRHTGTRLTLVYIDNILVFFWSMVEHHSISVVLNKISNSFSSRQKNAPSVIIHCSYLTITSVKTIKMEKNKFKAV